MTTQELINYIKQQSQQGKNKEEIGQELRAVGWEEKDIEEAFNIAGLARPIEPSAPAAPAKKEDLIPSTLPIVENLLKRSFAVYKARLGTFVGIMLFPLIVGSLVFILSLLLINTPLVIFFLIIFIPIMIIIGIWSQVSLIFAIKDREEKIGITESLRRGWKKIISFAWVSILAFFIIMGGYVLLIIPGIIFSIWLAFSTYVLVSEDLRGMNALFRSKQLTAGYWWKVLWRFIVTGIIIFIPVVLLHIILIVLISDDLADPLIRIITALFITPFNFTFGFLLYEDLKKQKAKTPFEAPKKGTKITFILVGIIGLLLIPAIIFSTTFFTARQTRGVAQDARILINMSMIRSAAEMIYSKDNSYRNVSCDHSDLVSLCNDTKNFTGKEPIFHSSQDSYCVYTKLLSGKYYCSDSTFRRTETVIFPGGKGYCDGITFKCP